VCCLCPVLHATLLLLGPFVPLYGHSPTACALQGLAGEIFFCSVQAFSGCHLGCGLRFAPILLRRLSCDSLHGLGQSASFTGPLRQTVIQAAMHVCKLQIANCNKTVIVHVPGCGAGFRPVCSVTRLSAFVSARDAPRHVKTVPVVCAALAPLCPSLTSRHTPLCRPPPWT